MQSQQDLLQRLPWKDTEPVFQVLQEKGFLLIQDLESLRLRNPGLYTSLKPQKIRCGAAARVMQGDRLVGFWGVDNMDPTMIPLFQPLLGYLEKLMESMIRSRNLRRELGDIDFRDPVTGFYNLKALHRHGESDREGHSLAVIYARVEENPDTEQFLLQVRDMRDRSLILEMGKSKDRKNFITSLVYACHQFGKKVCMEGVETAEQNRMVRDAACDMIQGFYYFRPMEMENVYRLMAEQKGKLQEPVR